MTWPNPAPFIHFVGLLVWFGFAVPSLGQSPRPDPAKEKFVLLHNGATVGMIIQSVIKADKQRLKLTDQQLPKAQAIITQAVVAFNDGVKQLKASKRSQQLRALAIRVETDKVRAYKAILTPEQYAILAAQHKKMYPESNV